MILSLVHIIWLNFIYIQIYLVNKCVRYTHILIKLSQLIWTCSNNFTQNVWCQVVVSRNNLNHITTTLSILTDISKICLNLDASRQIVGRYIKILTNLRYFSWDGVILLISFFSTYAQQDPKENTSLFIFFLFASLEFRWSSSMYSNLFSYPTPVISFYRSTT
jgi:hypothetical protein